MNDAVVQGGWTLPKNFAWSNAEKTVWVATDRYTPLQSKDEPTTEVMDVGGYYFPSTF